MPQPSAWGAAVRARTGLIVAALLLVALLAGSAAVSRPAAGQRATAAGWRAVGVRALALDSGDLRSVTHRWPCARQGDGGWRDGRCDPWGRLFNYPAVWLAPARLGWGPSATRPLALAEAALLFVALWTLFPATGWKDALFTGALALSPPVMFALERGNIDMAVFAGLVLGLRLTHGLPPPARDRARALLFALLAFLKIFPAAAFAVLARSLRGAALAAAGAALTAAGLALAYGDTLGRLQANMFHELDTNYGRLWLFTADSAVSPWRSPAGMASLAALALTGAAGAALGVRRGAEVRAALGDLLDGSLQADLAAAGVAVFGFTYALGLNYDYRLIFLLPVLPLLLARDRGRWSTPAAGAAAALAFRLMFAHRWPDAWLAGLDWGLWTAASAWATASAWPRMAAPSRARTTAAAPAAALPAG